MRLIAAIPNYNAAHNLPHLLRSLHDEPFDAIYVLDDASTDNSLAVLDKMNSGTIVIADTENKGPGGNRNRILPHLQDDDIVYFIDADMELMSASFKQRVVELFMHEPDLAIAGSLIFNKDSAPMTFNYGHYLGAPRETIGHILEFIARLSHFSPVQQALRPFARWSTYNLDIRYGSPKKVYVNYS